MTNSHYIIIKGMKTNVKTKKKILKQIGERIKLYRKLAKLSQETLAFDIGVDRTYIGGIEQGLKSPSLYCLFMIAKRLNLDFKTLLDIDMDI